MIEDMPYTPFDPTALISLWYGAGAYLQQNAVPVGAAILLISIAFLADRLASAYRRMNYAEALASVLTDVLRNDNRLNHGEESMGKDIGRIVQERLFSLPEIRRIACRLMKKNLVELVQKGVIFKEDHDVLCEHLAFQYGMWELFPKRKFEVPKSAEVKERIRARLELAAKGIHPQLPGETNVVPLDPNNRLSILKRHSA